MHVYTRFVKVRGWGDPRPVWDRGKHTDSAAQARMRTDDKTPQRPQATVVWGR